MNSGFSDQSRCVADALGWTTLEDEGEGVNPSTLRALYCHARDEDGKRELFQGDQKFVRGWVNLESERAIELISMFVDLDENDDIKTARRIARANLEAVAWNDILGIDEPPIRIRIMIHGAKWGMRFQSCTPARKGEELVNEQLPPIPHKETRKNKEPDGQQTGSAPQIAREAQTLDVDYGTVGTDEAAEILRQGGLPA